MKLAAHFRRFRLIAVLLPLLVAMGCSQGIPGATVRWDDVPYLPGSMEKPQSVRTMGAAALKVDDDGTYLYVAIYGYQPPSVQFNIIVPTDDGMLPFDRRVDYWRVILDSDAMERPHVIELVPGEQRCADINVKLAEHPRKRMIELAYPVDAIETNPVHIRVERIVRLFNGNNEAAPLVFRFPETSAAVYSSESASLVFDQRVPRVEDLIVDEIQCDSVALQWSSNKRLTTRVDLAPDGEALRTACDTEPPWMQHDVLLTDLRPDTIYNFSVGGSDFAGHPAPPISGTFRTAVAAPNEQAIRAMDVSFLPVKLVAPAKPESAGTSAGVPRGLPLQANRSLLWRIGRELSPGTYRISLCMWHGADGAPVELGAIRTGEVPSQFRRVDLIQPMKDGKLHQYDSVLKIETAFDAIGIKGVDGTAGPITAFRIYEVVSGQRP